LLAKQFEHNCLPWIYAERSFTEDSEERTQFADLENLNDPSRERVYFWNFCHSIFVFGLDMEETGRSDTGAFPEGFQLH